MNNINTSPGISLMSDEVGPPYLLYVRVRLGKYHKTYAMLDGGSTTDTIPPALVKTLDVPLREADCPWSVRLGDDAVVEIRHFVLLDVYTGDVVTPLIFWVMGGPSA